MINNVKFYGIRKFSNKPIPIKGSKLKLNIIMLPLYPYFSIFYSSKRFYSKHVYHLGNNFYVSTDWIYYQKKIIQFSIKLFISILVSKDLVERKYGGLLLETLFSKSEHTHPNFINILKKKKDIHHLLIQEIMSSILNKKIMISGNNINKFVSFVKAKYFIFSPLLILKKN